MKKLIVSVLMLIIACSGLFANGDDPPGLGTSGSPYQISTLDHLSWISDNSSSWSSYFEQTADIDASATSEWGSGGWSPIGNNSTKFTGSYDGQGHTIDGLYINRSGTWYQGFFGYTDGATISNLGVINVDITGTSYVAGLVGRSASESSSSTINKCFSSGSVSGSGYYIGGLVGYNDYSTVSNCYSNCSASASSGDVGGLVGYDDYGSVSNCYATGDVSGDYSGGLIGDIGWTTVSKCYSTGAVTGSSDVGGLIGYDYLSSSSVTNSFWDTETSGTSSSPGGGTGKTPAEMKTQSTFTAPTGTSR